MQQEHWQQPVQAAGLAIKGPLEAIRFMDRCWPSRKTSRFAHAHHACLAALDGRESAGEARDCFEEAVHEAQLH